MSHKHNRRRVRPRSRQQKNRNLDGISTPSLAPDTRSPTFASSGSGPSPPSLCPFSKFTQSPTNLMTAHHWQNRHAAWQSRELAQRREAVRLQDQQLKIFGGEPGDDVDLCYKMLEVFEGMQWVDS